MSEYNWCHNDKCHTYRTTDRIRGVKGSKVLRTRKIKVNDLSKWYYSQGWENHFCRVACFFDFVKKHFTDIVALAPVHEPSETPIDVVQEKVERYNYTYENGEMIRNPYISIQKTIKPINN